MEAMPLFSGPHTARAAPSTSFAAAKTAGRRALPVREKVKAFALRCGSAGFVDDELFAGLPGEKINTLRPRRSDLTDENWLIDSGRRIKNTEGHDCIVWLHRDFVLNAPPVKPQGGKRPSRAVQAELKAVLALIVLHRNSTGSHDARDALTQLGEQLQAGAHHLS